MARTRLLALALLALPAIPRPGEPEPSSRPTLRAAEEAYARYELAASRELHRALAADEGAPAADRRAAILALARADWRFDRDAAAALARLDAALQRSPDASVLWAERSRVAAESGAHAGALAAAERAAATAASADERTEAAIALARATGALHPPGARPDAAGRARLQAAARALDAALEREPGHPAASEALLGLALTLDDGPRVLEAWRSRFLVSAERGPPPVLADAHARLARLARGWRGRPLAAGERRALVRALAGSRFHGLATKLAGPLPRDRWLGELAAYQAFVEGVEAVNGDFYPRVAKGLRGYEAAYDAAIAVHARALWAVLSPGRPFRDDGFWALLRERFGTEGYVGRTVGFHGMLMGHVVEDERRRVEQYGHAGELRYVAIDRLISRDFTSWYGTTNVGGWGTASTMFQIRAAYVEEPFERLRWVSDAAARAQVEAELARLEAVDAVGCAAGRDCDPGSVALRIKLRAADALWAALGRRGLAPRERALAFVAECLRLNVEATVFAHEGRHAIDQRDLAQEFAAMGDDERELRAKLSEVAFSSDPVLALTGSILGAGLDDTSGHGLANRRLRALLVEWMRRHGAEVPGLDLARPLLLQVDLLSGAQLVAIVRGADPLARR